MDKGEVWEVDDPQVQAAIMTMAASLVAMAVRMAGSCPQPTVGVAVTALQVALLALHVGDEPDDEACARQGEKLAEAMRLQASVPGTKKVLGRLRDEAFLRAEATVRTRSLN